MNIIPHNETVHRELIGKIDSLLEFCKAHGYSHLILIGKDGQCSRYMEGTFDDIEGMVSGFVKDNKSFGAIVDYSNSVK